MPTPKPIVALAAEHASIDFGGEAAIPCHYFRELNQRGIETHLITHERCKSFMDKHCPQHTDRIHYIPDTKTQIWLNKASKPLPNKISYFTLGMLVRQSTQKRIIKKTKELIKNNGINLIHQPIPVSPKEPSRIRGMGVPVVIGPMNGGMSYPPAFQSHEGITSRLFMKFGKSIANITNQLMPGKLEAAILLVANQRTKKALPSKTKGKVIEIVENGIDPNTWNNSNHATTTPPPPNNHFLYVGRLVDWKAVDILLDAAHAASNKQPVRLTIIGDGSDKPKLEKQAQAIMAQQPDCKIHFSGWQSQETISHELQQATALVLSSLYECGGAVVLEAMATGTTAIATDWGGPADYLDATTGILIKATNREQMVHDFSDAMLKLMNNPPLVQSLGEQAKHVAQEKYTWPVKIDQILDVYDQALANHQQNRHDA